MFQGFGLKGKVLAMCITLAVFISVIGGVGLYSTSSVTKEYSEVAHAFMPSAIRLGKMQTAFYLVRVQVNSTLVPEFSAEMRADAVHQLLEAFSSYEEAEKAYLALPFGAGEEELYKASKEAFLSYKKNVQEFLRLMATQDPADRAKAVELRVGPIAEYAAEVSKNLTAIISLQAKFSDHAVIEASSAAQFGNVLSAVCAAVGTVFALLMGWLFARNLSRSLQAVAKELASGAGVVASASQQLLGAGETLSSSAAEQAAALQETVASVDEISAMVSRNAESAQQSQRVSNQSQEAAGNGKRAVDDMIASISEIDQANIDIMQNTEASNREISEIVKVISEIGNKTKVINDIVFQTKLLSFNASVEAARAGEHGKGFAVVAEEVGNLAQMSGNAAKEISQMLESSIRKVEDIVTKTRTSVETLVRNSKSKIERGSQTATNCGRALEELVRNASDLNKMVTEIAGSSKEQATGVQEITKAMGVLDEVTHRNAAAAEQSSTAASQLDIQARSVQALVERLVAIVEGRPAVGKTDTTARVEQAAPMAADASRVLQFKSSKRSVHTDSSKPNSVNAVPLKVAAGSDILPAADDPRFQDV